MKGQLITSSREGPIFLSPQELFLLSHTFCSSYFMSFFTLENRVFIFHRQLNIQWKSVSLSSQISSSCQATSLPATNYYLLYTITQLQSTQSCAVLLVMLSPPSDIYTLHYHATLHLKAAYKQLRTNTVKIHKIHKVHHSSTKNSAHV